MRPDKHKKKSHAAYAKKAAAKAGKSSKPSSVSGQDAPTKQSRGTKEREQISREGPQEVTQHAGNSLPLENDETHQSRPSFTRRNIQSNWQQYDENPEAEEAVEQRGADFSLLLNQTAGSQFRFKGEEELDEDVTQTSISSILSFDCNLLAERLQSISLPERLQISRVFFDQETLGILDQDAATHTPGSINQTPGSTVPSEKPKTGDEAYFDEDLDDILSMPSSVNISNSPSSQVTQTKDSVDGVTVEDHSQTGNVDKPSQSRLQQSNGNSEDDVLDFLLSLSSEDKATTDEARGELEPIIGNVPGELKTNGVLSKKDTLSGETLPSPQKSSSNMKTESLDDWLDSILDD